RRLAAPRFIVVGAVERDRGLTASTHAGDEVRRVDEEVTCALRLPERRIKQRQRRYLAAQDRRLVYLRAVEPPADLRVGTHAFSRAENGDLYGLGADKELHLQGRGLTRAQRDVLEILVAESFLGHADCVG